MIKKNLAEKNILKIDRDLYKLGKSVEILDRLKWKRAVGVRFLKKWKAGNFELPQVLYPAYSTDSQRQDLKSIKSRCDVKHPMGKVLFETADCYLTALRMVQNIGNKHFLELSEKLYGSPTDTIGKLDITTHKAANFFLEASKQFKGLLDSTESDFCLMPEYVVERIDNMARKVFGEGVIEVRTDSKLAAKASAGYGRIRVRGTTCFAEYDVDQLVNHELLVHTLTLRNGRKQRYKCLGINSPRTTRTQEGLAVFSEFVTSSIDMHRLRRLSARVKAVEMGIQGADFIEVFQFFLEQGQTEFESYNSTMRVFRGGRVKGGIVFTKDIVYLRGFIDVHRFFLRALRDKKFMYPDYLFSGRMSVNDVAILEPHFLNGNLKEPFYKPDWIKNRSSLLAFLLSSSMMYKLGLAKF